MLIYLPNIMNYNIPSNNRELQLYVATPERRKIITYQVITGNYSGAMLSPTATEIITYQVITGNYSSSKSSLPMSLL